MVRFFRSDTYKIHDEELRQAAVRNGFYKIGYNVDLVKDLATVESGLSLHQTPEEVAAQLVEQANQLVFVPYNGQYPLETKRDETTPDLAVKRGDWVMYRLPGYVKFGQTLPNQPQVNSKDMLTVSNPTPLDKAFFLLRQMMEQKKATINTLQQAGLLSPSNFNETEEEEEDRDDPKDSLAWTPLDPTLDVKFSDSTGYWDFMLQQAIGKNREAGFKALDERTLRKILEVSSTLSANSRVTPSPLTLLERDPMGTTVRYRSSEGFSDLPNMPGHNWVKSPQQLFLALNNGEIQISDRASRIPEVPVIMILLDRSGSMSSGPKVQMALGVLWYMVKQVIAKKAIVVFSFFEGDADFFHVLDYRFMDRADLVDWFQKVTQASFCGGETAVGVAARKALDFFDEMVTLPHNKGIKVAKNHLVIINDGEDDATSLTIDDLRRRKCKLSAFILRNYNEHLEYLAVNTRGYYLGGI